jgi:hypothetical protein
MSVFARFPSLARSLESELGHCAAGLAAAVRDALGGDQEPTVSFSYDDLGVPPSLAAQASCEASGVAFRATIMLLADDDLEPTLYMWAHLGPEHAPSFLELEAWDPSRPACPLGDPGATAWVRTNLLRLAQNATAAAAAGAGLLRHVHPDFGPYEALRADFHDGGVLFRPPL